MKTTTLIILMLAIITIHTYPVQAGIRCGNDIISIGDISSEVMIKLKKCGEVLNKEVISKETVIETDVKKIGDKVKKETLTERWYIRVKESGGTYCYPLSFEEGSLQSIGIWRKCD